MYECFSEQTRNVMKNANLIATEHLDVCISPVHILLALVRQWSALTANVFVSFQASREDVERIIAAVLGTPHPHTHGLKLANSFSSKRLIEIAMEQARELHHNYVGTEHLLLALTHIDDGRDAVPLERVFKFLEIDRSLLREKILEEIRVIPRHISFASRENLAPNVMLLRAQVPSAECLDPTARLLEELAICLRELKSPLLHILVVTDPPVANKPPSGLPLM